jgi:hypothetical protein
MRAKRVLQTLDLGSSVAEHDVALERYFVETETFRTLISDGCDVVAGDKGTGKTALYRILKERYRQFPELAGVEIVPAFNPAGAPVFQRLAESTILSEQSYIGVWKSYLLALIGNWILGIAEGDYDENLAQLDDLLVRIGLRSIDDTPQTVFSQLVNRIKRLLRRTSTVELSGTVTPVGIPIIGARLEFSDDERMESISRHDDALRLLNKIMEKLDITVWVVLDRLDEAFQGQPALETPVLRALLRTYLDSLEFDRLRVKLFVRKDLFGRITSGGFVNLTHVNARKIEITWDDEDLYNLLFWRLADNEDFLSILAPLLANQMQYLMPSSLSKWTQVHVNQPRGPGCWDAYVTGVA